MCLSADWVKTHSNYKIDHRSGFLCPPGRRVHLQLNTRCGEYIYIFFCKYVCADVHLGWGCSSSGGVDGAVPLLLLMMHHWAWLFWCAAFLLLSTLRGLGGIWVQKEEEGAWGVKWGVYDWDGQKLHSSLLTFHSRHAPSASFCLFVVIRVLRPLTNVCLHRVLQIYIFRPGAHVTTRANWTSLCSFLSRALCWHNTLPPTAMCYGCLST